MNRLDSQLGDAPHQSLPGDMDELRREWERFGMYFFCFLLYTTIMWRRNRIQDQDVHLSFLKYLI